MSMGTIIVAALVTGIVILAVRSMINDRKSGNACASCGNGCSHCHCEEK